MCNLRMSELDHRTTQIYGALFIAAGVIAAICNSLAIVIIWMPGHRTRSNRILTSLVISDALFGYILLPLIAYQMFNKEALKSCTVDIARRYLSVITTETSTMTMCILSIDRYFSLTNLYKYNKYMNMRKTNVLLTLAWLIASLTPLVNLVGKKAFIAVKFTIIAVSLTISFINYCVIAITIYTHTRVTKEQSRDNSNSVEIVASTHHSPGVAENRSKTVRKRHLNLAKQFLLLITCDVICLSPLFIWMLVDFLNIGKNNVHNFYVFATLLAGANSCLNPFIYVWKNPEFKKGIKRLLSWKRSRRAIGPNN